MSGGWDITLKATNHMPDWAKSGEQEVSETFVVVNKRDWDFGDFHAEVNIRRNAFAEKTYGFALDSATWLSLFDVMAEDLEKHAGILANAVVNTWNKINGPSKRAGLRQVRLRCHALLQQQTGNK